MESEHEQFRRLADGVIGVGFIQTHTGIPTAAIAWPDREPSRYVLSDLDGVGVELMLDEGHLPRDAEEQPVNRYVLPDESNAPMLSSQTETEPVVAPVTETVTEPPQPVVESVETTTSSEPVVQTATDEQLTPPVE